MDNTRARWHIPALVAVATALALLAVWVVTNRDATDGPSSSPAVLRLQSTGGGSRGAEMTTASDSKIAGPTGSYVLTGALPSGPDAEKVLPVGGATQAQVDRLAAAFGLPAAKRTGDHWTATSATHQLTVQATGFGSWQFGQLPQCPPADLKDEAGDIGPCTSAEQSDSWSGEMADDATVRSVAAPLLVAAGVALDSARVRVESGSITVDPRVQGRPTVGLQTSIAVGPKDEIVWANGWLGSLGDGAAYPLLTAAEAFAELQKQERMSILRCAGDGIGDGAALTQKAAPPSASASGAPGKKGTSDVQVDPPAGELVDPAADFAPCVGADPEPLAVTGAEFGWSVQWLEDTSTVLTPAWLFQVKGSDGWLTPTLAIEPQFLAEPAPSDPGSIEPAPAESAPAETAPDSGPRTYSTTAPAAPTTPASAR